MKVNYTSAPWFKSGKYIMGRHGEFASSHILELNEDVIKLDGPDLSLILAAPDLLEACQYYEEALDYLFKKLNFGASALDAKAITYMNEMGLKGKAAISKATNSI